MIRDGIRTRCPCGRQIIIPLRSLNATSARQGLPVLCDSCAFGDGGKWDRRERLRKARGAA